MSALSRCSTICEYFLSLMWYNYIYNIQVCEGDELVIRVHNKLSNGESTSIHWHGLHQTNTVYMDGVARLTQCPILPSMKFEYRWLQLHIAIWLMAGVIVNGANVNKLKISSVIWFETSYL